MAQATVIGAPKQEAMGNAGGEGLEAKVQQLFGDKNGLLVKQTMRGCLQECLGCEAKSEFKVAAMDFQHIEDGYKITDAGMAQPDIMYALEESSCCCRLCWRDGRSFDMVLSEGSEKGGAEVLHYVKPCGFPLNFSIPTNDSSIDCPCCCMLPELSSQTPGGADIGNKSKYICDINLAVPKLEYSEGGKPVYILKPETCCGGCCIACNPCSGKGLLYIPFYFHDPESMNVIGGGYDADNTPQIRKVWAGIKKECCSTADTFAVLFPSGIDPVRKAGLLGLTFLLDFTVFERQQEKN